MKTDLRSYLDLVEMANKPYIRSWLNISTKAHYYVDDKTASHVGMLRANPTEFGLTENDALNANGDTLIAKALANNWVRISSDTKDEWKKYIYIEAQNISNARRAINILKATLEYDQFVVDTSDAGSFTLDRKSIRRFLSTGEVPT